MSTTPVCDFGWKAHGFDLPGTDGRRHRLADAADQIASMGCSIKWKR